MASWGSWSYLYGPLMALVGVGLLISILHWASRRGVSVVEQPVRPAAPSEYGLLRAVSCPDTYIEAEITRRTLEDGGLRATVAMTNDGPRVMVWPVDEAKAKQLLASADGQR